MSDMMENYKGIMLCSRPQEQINLNYKRSFVSRVHADEQIGYNPVPKINFQKPIKRTKPVLRKHREWLDKFSEIQKSKREEQMKAKTQNNSKKQKPEWALSESQVQQKQEQDTENEVQDLLNFAKGLDYETYIKDLEVKIMLEALKTRVKELSTQTQEEKQQYIKKEEEENENEKKKLPVKKTRFEPSEEWDKATVSENNQKLTIEERLAKHIADEILRKNKYLRGIHSNLSLRRILEMEAQKELTKT